jgi:hypothetical protein
VDSRWRGIARRIAEAARRGAPRLLRARRPAAQPRDGRAPAGRRPAGSAARTISYSPQLDGQADPGEIVWSWVAYEDDPARGKDRPVLVIARDGAILFGLMLSSQHERDGQRNWLALGPGPWDRETRPSWVRLDRVLELSETGIRREGAVLDRVRFETVARRLRASYGWS